MMLKVNWWACGTCGQTFAPETDMNAHVEECWDAPTGS